ncbi:hypothetical protein K2173_021929 [Erythroxylum novogranatense]|uniref:Uncharacterized protein n=1 Tax=Erythroxylum novogranatense TaxID=1862640 RepID=A0AAV8T3C8_9ROSI|nr:hypothetical protein K2173_021929 [Erythroxylum novogranatense]
MGSSKVFLGPVPMAGFVWLLLVGSLQSGAGKTMAVRIQSSESFANEQMIRKDKLVHSPEQDLSYMMNKRRIPNGPDPIHNRRAGSAARPPGRA